MSNILKHPSIFLWILLLLAACSPIPKKASTASCPPPETPHTFQSQELNLLVRKDRLPIELIDCFEWVYGVKVKQQEYESNEEMYVRTAVGGTKYDLIQPAEVMVPLLINGNYLQEIDHEKLLLFKNLDPQFTNLNFDPENRYTVPYQAGAYGIVVNSKTVPNPILTWRDLLNPQYRHRIIVPDDSRIMIGISLLMTGQDPNTIDIAQLQTANEQLLELKPNLQIFDTLTPHTSLLSGQADLGIVSTQEAQNTIKKNNFYFTYPQEGPILWVDNWALPATSKNTEVAYAWLNYTMQANVFWHTQKDLRYTSPNLAALNYLEENQPDLYASYTNNPLLNIPAEVLAKGIYLTDVGNAQPLYDQIWVRIKSE